MLLGELQGDQFHADTQAVQQPRQQLQQALAALGMIGDLQAPEQVVDRLQVAHRRFRLLALGEHVLGDDLRPGAGDEATDRRRGAHLHHLVGQALRQVLLQDLASLRELERIDRGLGRAQLPLELFRQVDVDTVEAPAKQRRVRRPGPGHLFGNGAGERQEAREARVLDARVADAHLADPVEQAPYRMVVRIEHRVLGENHAQHGDLHARDQGPEGAGKLGVDEERFEQPRRELDDLAIDRLAGAGNQRGPVLLEAIAAGRSASGQGGLGRGMAQQLVEAQQRLLELRIAPRRTVAAHRAGHAGVARGRSRGGPVVAAWGRPVGRAGHARQQRAQRAGTRRLGRREAAEARPRRQDDRAIGSGLNAGAFESGRRRRPGVLEQPGDDAGGRAQHDRALNLGVHDRAGGVPQGRCVDERPERIRFGVDVALADQGRGEGLQLAQLPLGRAVDQLHRPRDLDVDLDARFVHQLEAAEPGARLGEARFAWPVDLFANALGQRFDEGLLEQAGVALQGLDDLGVVAALTGVAAAVLRRAEKLHGARQDPLDERGREGQFVLDETLVEGRGQQGPRGERRDDYPAEAPASNRRGAQA